MYRASGGWPEGQEHGIFRLGFTALAVQLFVLVFGRLGLLHRAAPLELRADIPCPLDCCHGNACPSSPFPSACLSGCCLDLSAPPGLNSINPKSINRTIRKVSHCLSYRVCINAHAGCCCTPLYVGAVSATLAIAALLPMAWIPFWVSPLHFVAAAVVFIMLVRRPI